jgi:hypothetical protein
MTWKVWRSVCGCHQFCGPLGYISTKFLRQRIWHSHDGGMVMQVRADAEKEFDRTMDYIAATIKALKQMRDDELTMLDESGVIAILHRTPIGFLCSCHLFFTSSTTAS